MGYNVTDKISPTDGRKRNEDVRNLPVACSFLKEESYETENKAAPCFWYGKSPV